MLPSANEYVVIKNKDDLAIATELFGVDILRLPFYLILNSQDYSQLAEIPVFQGFATRQINNNNAFANTFTNTLDLMPD